MRGAEGLKLQYSTRTALAKCKRLLVKMLTMDIGAYCRRRISSYVGKFRHKISSYVDVSYIDKKRTSRLTAKCKEVGKNLIVRSGVIILCPERLTIGDDVAINDNVWINAAGGISIGNYVIIGPKSVIHSANHKFDDVDIPIQKQGHYFKHTVIENDVWLAAAVVVTPGARIGKGSVIGAGSVVVGDIPPYSVAVGVPARVVKSRK